MLTGAAQRLGVHGAPGRYWSGDAGLAALAAALVTIAWFSLTWRVGFDLADEGFYWYGAQRVLRGDVPLRDFQSYDVGRYYWAALFMRMFGGDDLFTARVAAAAFQSFGTFLGVFVCLRAVRAGRVERALFALLVAAILTLWVVRYYKSFDIAASLLVVASLALMASSGRARAWFGAGLCIGLAAVVGRNHGVYGAVAGMLLIAAMAWRGRAGTALLRVVPLWMLGIATGFAPVFLMMLAVPGFAAAMWESITSMIQSGSTNIALPVPWPWKVNLRGADVWRSAIHFSVGLGFIFAVVIPVVAFGALAFRQIDLEAPHGRMLIAAWAAAVPYAHYAFARADTTHLSLGILPALIVALAFLSRGGGWRCVSAAAAGLCVSVLMLCEAHPYLVHRVRGYPLVEADAGGVRVRMGETQARRMRAMLEAPPASGARFDQVLALPHLIGLYALERAKFPLWECYPLTRRPAVFERMELARLESSPPRLIILSNHALDGRPEMRYSALHPVMYDWITSRYAPAPPGTAIGDPDVTLFLPRS